MKLKIVQARNFSKTLDSLMKKRLLLKDDFDEFQRALAENPDLGVIIPGAGGVRKTRLKGASKGKSGGFRVCYYYLVGDSLFLLLIYAKNEQENLTAGEKKELKTLVKMLKETK